MNFLTIPDKGFEMMDAPVTQSEWQEIMGSNPSRFSGLTNSSERPVERISWNDCQEFIQILSDKQDGFTYRLPTEEEWEYCCRAGSDTEYCFGNDILLDYLKKRAQPLRHMIKKQNNFLDSMRI